MIKKLLAATIMAFSTTPAFAADLSLTFQGAMPADGPLMVAIHDSAQTFSGGGADGAVSVAILPPGATGLIVQGLAPATYAIKAYQDTNGDRVLNIGPDRRPIEPVAVSGRQTGGWPDFSAAAIKVENSASVTLGFSRP